MIKDEENEKDQPICQKIKNSMFALMEKVMENSEAGFVRVVIIKIFEFLFLLSFSFHNLVRIFIMKVGFPVAAKGAI